MNEAPQVGPQDTAENAERITIHPNRTATAKVFARDAASYSFESSYVADRLRTIELTVKTFAVEQPRSDCALTRRLNTKMLVSVIILALLSLLVATEPD